MKTCHQYLPRMEQVMKYLGALCLKSASLSYSLPRGLTIEILEKREKKTDLTAAISNIFEQFIDNCKQNYKIGEYACVDKVLVEFRSKCKFRMNMALKPRYGIQIIGLNDARTLYLFHAYIYSGENCDGDTLPEEEKKLGKATQSVLR